jgi:transcriptional regulator
MYVPAAFDASDLGFCRDLIRAYPFATVTTTTETGELFASHLPFLLDEDRGPLGTLIAHVARANPQREELAKGSNALVVFTGPHAYISPAWYETHPAVPTWNYCVVHAYGSARILDDGATQLYLARLAESFERSRDSAWRVDALAPDYRIKMMHGIVAFELEIRRLEGKAKLSQNRSAGDVSNVIAALETSNETIDRDLAHWMKRFRHSTS